MIQNIEISNFKAIRNQPLILENLTKVNYLVGPNGSGKSSILESLQCMSAFKENLDSKDFEELLSIELYQFFDKRVKKWPDEVEIENFKAKKFDKWEDFKIKVNKSLYTIANNSKFRKKYGDSLIKVQCDSYDDLKSAKFLIEFFKDAEKVYDFEERLLDGYLDFKSIKLSDLDFCFTLHDSNYGYHNNYHNKTHVKNLSTLISNLSLIYGIEKSDFLSIIGEDRIADYQHLYAESSASGIANMFLISGIEFLILNSVTNKSKILKNKRIILLEEPETALHPKLQKALPVLLNRFLQNVAGIKKYKDVQFFISTHSPFLISGAGELTKVERENWMATGGKKEDFAPSQKVYLIKEAQTVDLQKKPTERGRSGYEGRDCKFVASQMLGAQISDFTPSKIVFCEKSLCGFLKNVNSRFYNQNIQFKPVESKSPKNGTYTQSSSDLEIVSLFEKYVEIYQLNDNLYENSELIFIIDTPQIKELKAIKDKLKSSKNKEIKCLVLTAEKLEVYLSPFNKGYESLTDKSKYSSEWKQLCALWTGENISLDDFETLEVFSNYGENETEKVKFHEVIFNKNT